MIPKLPEKAKRSPTQSVSSIRDEVNAELMADSCVELIKSANIFKLIRNEKTPKNDEQNLSTIDKST